MDRSSANISATITAAPSSTHAPSVSQTSAAKGVTNCIMFGSRFFLSPSTATWTIALGMLTMSCISGLSIPVGGPPTTKSQRFSFSALEPHATASRSVMISYAGIHSIS